MRIAIAVLLLCTFTSCVNVTTERRAESFSRTPEEGCAESSEVTVRTYGWDFLEGALHILILPFKLAHHAMKIVL
jgi:hypothetical protein